MSRLATISALAALSFLSPLPVSAQVTLYTGRSAAPSATEVTRAPDAQWTGLPMYDPLQLDPPAPPDQPIGTVPIVIPPNSAALAAGVQGEGDGTGLYLSIPQKGNFLGFSVELSVADSLMGSTADNVKPEFLNYLANIYTRAGTGPVVRVGGNTQDSSTIVPGGFGSTKYIEKSRAEASGPTDTPAVSYSPELLYAMANISSLVHAEWYFGLAFNESDVSGNWENIPEAASYAERILGGYLKGMPLGNEPDLYADHGKRQSGWGLNNYVSEWRDISSRVLDAAGSSGFGGRQDVFIAPSTCCQRPGFELRDVLDSGWLETNMDRVHQVSVQRYPNNNCQINGQPTNPQDVFWTYLNHGGLSTIIGNDYVEDMRRVQGMGKEVVMLETNTAACGGYPGVSTSFGAAMWLTDWSLQLAQTNFSQALMHVGGQNVYYNPFTPPPGTMSNVYQWTTGAVYYSTLVVAETFGQSNNSRIVDLRLGGDNADLHPAYAVYENDVPTRVVLFNYVSDAGRNPTGSQQYVAQLQFPEGNGHTVPSQVHIRYLTAPSVSEHDEIHWANQTTRGSYSSDGMLHGTVETVTLQCQGGQQPIQMRAPAQQAQPQQQGQEQQQQQQQPDGQTQADGQGQAQGDGQQAQGDGQQATADGEGQAQDPATTAAAAAPADGQTQGDGQGDTAAAPATRRRRLSSLWNRQFTAQEAKTHTKRQDPATGGTVTICSINVPAPGIALVFLSDEALANSSPRDGMSSAAQGFSTTVVGTGAATVAIGALQTSNGQNGPAGVDGRNNRPTGAGARGADMRGAVVGVGVAAIVGVLGMVLIKLERQL